MSDRIVKVKVTAGAKTEKIVELGTDILRVRVSTPPEKGKANERVAYLLAEYFKVPRSQVRLLSGTTYREKVFSIGIN